MDEKQMGKAVMDILCDIITVTSSAGRDDASTTNRVLKRLRDKIVNFIKQCQTKEKSE